MILLYLYNENDFNYNYLRIDFFIKIYLIDAYRIVAKATIKKK